MDLVRVGRRSLTASMARRGRVAGTVVATGAGVIEVDEHRAGEASMSTEEPGPTGTQWLGRTAWHPKSARRVGWAAACVAYGVLVLLSVLIVSGTILLHSASHDVRDDVTVAQAALEPSITDAVVDGDASALGSLRQVAQDLVDEGRSVRIRVFAADGDVYADVGSAVGTQDGPAPGDARAPVDGDRRSKTADGPMAIEVYSTVTTASGTPLLVEATYPYSLFAREHDRSVHIVRSLMAAGLLLCVPPLAFLWLMARRSLRHRVERERLLERLFVASDQERRRIAGSVHDGAVQDLMGVSLELQGAAAGADGELGAQLREIGGQVRTTVRGLRSLLHSVYPVDVPDVGWVSGLDDSLNALRDAGVAVSVDIPDWPLTRVEQWLLLRVAREALRNVHAHARATRVRVVLDRHLTRLRLTITDDGVGFDRAVADQSRAGGHLGLPLIHDLAEELGASLVVDSTPGKGTMVRLTSKRPA